MLANLVQHARRCAGQRSIFASASIPSACSPANGWNTMPWPPMEPIFAALIADLKSQGFQGPFAVGDGRPVHAAGGSEAAGVGLRARDRASPISAPWRAGGIRLDDARRHIFFRLAADQDQFLTIAKFRALRKLWARDRGGMRPRAPPGIRRRRNRVAHDDQARSAREHRAWHHRRPRRGFGRRRCRDRAALQRRARRAGGPCATYCPQHPDHPDRGIQSLPRRRSRRWFAAPSRPLPTRSAPRPGLFSRTSNAPAALARR